MVHFKKMMTMMKRVTKATVMKKNLVSLFSTIYVLFCFFSKNIDEEDDLSEDEISANPIEGKYRFFKVNQ